VKTEVRLAICPSALRIAALRRRHPGDHPGDCAAIPLAKRLHFGRRPGHQHLASRHALGGAGEAAGYLANHPGGRLAPDYRGGVSYSRATAGCSARRPRLVRRNQRDGVFVSRFQNDFLVYSQNRSGYTLPALGGFRSQFFAAGNITLDTQRQYWANFVELGPGLRLRWDRLPPALVFSVHLLRGVYTLNAGNPRGPNFFDLRAGFWYAFTR